MASLQAQDTTESEVTMISPRFSCTFTQDGVINLRMLGLSEWSHAETGPCEPEELVVGVVLKTVDNICHPREETGNRCPEKLILPHTA